MAIAGQYLVVIGKDDDLVSGESQGQGFEGSIDVRSWDWSVRDQSSPSGKKKPVGKGASSQPNLSTKSGVATSEEKGLLPDLFKFTKGVDFSSVRLMRAMEQNECLQLAKFVLREELVPGANDRHEPFLLHVVLDDAYVVGYSLQGRASESRVDLDESWELHYKTIRVDYVSAGGLTVNFERKAGAERDPDAGPDLNAKLDKTLALVTKLQRNGGG